MAAKPLWRPHNWEFVEGTASRTPPDPVNSSAVAENLASIQLPGTSGVENVDQCHRRERLQPVFKRAVHRSLILKDELAELDITPTDFARQIDVPLSRISQIIAGTRSVTGDTALRLGHWFGVDPQFWLNLQAQFDLAMAAEKSGDAVKELPTAAGSRR